MSPNVFDCKTKAISCSQGKMKKTAKVMAQIQLGTVGRVALLRPAVPGGDLAAESSVVAGSGHALAMAGTHTFGVRGVFS
jgi:hypothetical protein